MYLNESEAGRAVRLQMCCVTKTVSNKGQRKGLRLSSDLCCVVWRHCTDRKTGDRAGSAALKMLRFSLGLTRMAKIRNEIIRGTAQVVHLVKLKTSYTQSEAKQPKHGHVIAQCWFLHTLFIAPIFGHTFCQTDSSMHNISIHEFLAI